MNISVVGTGYVGLVTGVCLSEIEHNVTCIDIDHEKIETMKKGISPIYEPGLEELMKKNITENRLSFTTNFKQGIQNAEVIYIAVGTPENSNGSADLKYIEQVARDIADNINRNVIVVTKSTVPVGTNTYIKNLIIQNSKKGFTVEIVSNPEFLREGSAVYDSFNGDRIIIGANNEEVADVIAKINKPLNIPIMITDINSAEMIKYASNSFLATKISFINEIANVCERVGANITDVAKGMGADNRIGKQFLNAGIGYGGSCFPKDTKALISLAENAGYNFKVLKEVVNVNEIQKTSLLTKLKERFGSLTGMQISVLGLSFKPNTDDMREAPSIPLINNLIKEGANVIAYDPISIKNAKPLLDHRVAYSNSIEDAITGSDVAVIITEWDEIKKIDLNIFMALMRTPIIFDGRNCFAPEDLSKAKIEYHSVGKSVINNIKSEPITV